MASGYQYNAQDYTSPQRVWDVETQSYLDKWVTQKGFSITLPDGIKLYIPAKFPYDKGSIPRLVWWWFPRDDRKAVIAVLVHDFLYHHRMLTRARADRIFYDLLRLEGMRWSKAAAAYIGVRLGGGRAWQEDSGHAL